MRRAPASGLMPVPRAIPPAKRWSGERSYSGEGLAAKMVWGGKALRREDGRMLFLVDASWDRCWPGIASTIGLGSSSMPPFDSRSNKYGEKM